MLVLKLGCFLPGFPRTLGFSVGPDLGPDTCFLSQLEHNYIPRTIGHFPNGRGRGNSGLGLVAFCYRMFPGPRHPASVSWAVAIQLALASVALPKPGCARSVGQAPLALILEMGMTVTPLLLTCTHSHLVGSLEKYYPSYPPTG